MASQNSDSQFDIREHLRRVYHECRTGTYLHTTVPRTCSKTFARTCYQAAHSVTEKEYSRIACQYKEDDSHYWNFIRPELEHKIEGHNLKRNEGRLKRKEIDASAETQSGVNEAISKPYLCKSMFQLTSCIQEEKRRPVQMARILVSM
jgi:hypothetical protein